MYAVKFTKQAAKDARKLKAAGLDKKAKSLVEVLKRDPFQRPLPTKRLWETFPASIRGASTCSIDSSTRYMQSPLMKRACITRAS